MTETPSGPDTVAPFAIHRNRVCINEIESCQQSHPGPVFGGLGGVLQPAIPGKYSYIFNSSCPDVSPNSRNAISDSRTDGIWIYYQNSRGLRTKIDDLFLATDDCGYDVIVLTETGLNDCINSVQLFGSAYTVFRCDRNERNSTKTRFGGVLIAVATKHVSSTITTRAGSTIEQICVAATIRGKRLSICAVYIPPDRSREVAAFEQHVASVRELCDNASANEIVLACGDYNQPHLSWSINGDGIFSCSTNSDTPASSTLIDSMDSLNMRQHNVLLNHLSRTLDLVFIQSSDEIVAVNESSSPLLRVDPHHPPLVVSIAFPMRTNSCSVVVSDVNQRNFHKINFDHLTEFLSTTDWSVILNSNDVDELTDIFRSHICQWSLSNVPKSKRPSSPAWSTSELKRLKRVRNANQRRLRRCRTPASELAFRSASNDYRNLNKSLYKTYVLKVQTNLRRNPKSFWNFVNSKRKNSTIPPRTFLDEEQSSTELDTCEQFAKHFASVFGTCVATDQEAEQASVDVPLNVVDIDTFVITQPMFIAAANKLKNSFSPGPDGIPAVVYCRCAAALAAPLCMIFNRSFEQRKFPEIWKSSLLFPVYKTGDRGNVRNYRGITSLSAGSKLFEIIVSQKILSAVNCYISSDQHGFMPGRSVTTNLLDFTFTCFTNLESKAQVDVVYTDLKAAFDRIDHTILLRKLGRLGASDRLIEWLGSYLCGRTLRVKLGQCTSTSFSNLSGVPQGSNLGPLLFTIFFNDAAVLLGDGCKLIYADDLKLYVVVRSVEDCHRLQVLLNVFVDWCQRNKLLVSIPKCFVMTLHRITQPILYDYHIGGITLNRVEEMSDLGVLLDKKLNFANHRSVVIAKANRQLGFITKIAKDFKDPYCLKALYCSLVRPILENAALIWLPHQLSWSLRIERVQKRFIRVALRNLTWNEPYNLPPYRDRCRLIDLDTLARRRKIQQATFVAKLLNNEIDCPRLLSLLDIRVPSRSLRNTTLLQPRYYRTAFGLNSPISSMIRSFVAVEDLFEFGERSSVFSRRIARSNYFID